VPILRPFDPDIDEQRRRRFSHAEQKQLISEYVQLRSLLENPMASMHVKVLQPMCQCCLRPWPERDDLVPNSFLPIYPPRDNTYLYPARIKPKRLYLPTYRLMLFHREPKWEILCYFCQQEMEDTETFHVVEESFQKYFCLEDESKGLPMWLRKHILELYGNQCFHCKKPLSLGTLTIDHIRPKSKGGDSRPTNLQPMCADCNNRLKGSADPQECYVFLDFLTRRPPSDSCSDMLW
jgi:hypothetical protein